MKQLVLVFLCLLGTISVRAQFSGAGIGTSSDPYQITNADELAEMAYFLGDSHKGTCFKLMNDIDLTQWIADNNPTQGWTPIGVYSDRFKGSMDGDGHTISGIYINRSNFENIGFFGYVANATISNLIVLGSSVTGGNSTGGLIGHAYNSQIANCNVSLSSAGIVGTQNVGGLLGYGEGTTIQGCEYRGKVYASDNEVGGLIGRANSSNISDCSAYADIESAAHEDVGGIIGCTYYSLECTNCKHQGSIVGGNVNIGGVIGYVYPFNTNATVTKCSHNGKIAGKNNVGGIVGKIYWYNYDYSLRILQCFANGDIEGQQCVGGILGQSEGYRSTCGNGYINDCYANVNIVGIQFVGGILGRIYLTKGGEVRYCYMTGTIVGDDCVGGIVGNLDRYTISSNCVIASSIGGTSNVGRVCGLKSGGTIGAVGSQQGNRAYAMCEMIISGSKESVLDDEKNGTAISLSALKGSAAFSGLGWDFTDTWTINNGKTFPYLKWEKRVSAIELNKTTANLAIGESTTIIASVTPTDADLKDLNWITSDESIVKVESDGTITAVAEGTASITATAKDGSEISATCIVIVSNTNDSNPADFDNVVYIESFAAELGDEIDLPILLNNQVAGDISGFDFYLYLPEGISPLLDDDEFPILSISTGRTTTRKHSIYGDIEEDGSIHVYTIANRPTYTFSGTEGEVATIAIKVANDAPNGIQQIVLRNIMIESLSQDEPFSVARFNLSASIGKLSFEVNDGTSMSIAQNKIYDEITYSRTFNNTTWQALYVPFSIPVAALEENGLQVAELNDSHMYDRDDDGVFEEVTIEFLRLTLGSTEANMPYMIRALEAGEKQITLTDVELKAAAEVSIDCSTTKKLFTFTGTYSGVDGETMFANHYYAISGGALKPAANSSVGLKPQRWYMSIENRDGSPMEYNDNAPSIRLMVNGEWAEEIEEETTGLHTIGQAQPEGKIYTLEGVRVLNASRPGMYVQNGKIVVRK